jgi:intracellular sulfur oxidation DsrE/DsrF family protein
MTDEYRVSEEMQSAYVDGELAPVEWARVAEAQQRDERLRRELCELRAVKELVQRAYPAGTRDRRAPAPMRWAGIAALCVLGVTAGWLGRAAWTPQAIDVESALTAGTTLREATGDRVLVHVTTARRDAVVETLDEVEALLRAARRDGRRLRIEIVANSSGLNLLRADVTPFAGRLEALRAAYPGLTLVACNQTMNNLRERGVTVKLLPGVEVAPSALDEVVKRLQLGWTYVRA